MNAQHSPITIDVPLGPSDLDDALRSDVRRGLLAIPKALPPKWFYDEQGCALFDQITRLSEYYPTEAERSILHAHARAIAITSGADTMVELGSGSTDKTRVLLDALSESGQLRRFSPFEINEPTLRSSIHDIHVAYPDIEVHAVVGDFERHLSAIPKNGRRMIVFLGGTIGNFIPAERTSFFAELASTMSVGDTLLLGTDLVKDIDRLEAAYNDVGGITADFNRNVLAVVNRELDADFDLSQFEHRAWFDQERSWIEMKLRSLVAQQVHVRALDLVVHFARDEEMRTEVSTKFRRDQVEVELSNAGLMVEKWMTDPAGDFALSLSFKI